MSCSANKIHQMIKSVCNFLYNLAARQRYKQMDKGINYLVHTAEVIWLITARIMLWSCMCSADDRREELLHHHNTTVCTDSK